MKSRNDDDTTGIVFDLGSQTARFGNAGDDEPQIVRRTVISGGGNGADGTWIGHHAQSKFGEVFERAPTEGDSSSSPLHLSFQNFVQRGVVTDFDALEKYAAYLFGELKADPTKCNVVFLSSAEGIRCSGGGDCDSAAPVWREQRYRDMLQQVFFERLGVQGLICSPASVASLYCNGRTTGVVAEIGHGAMQVQAMYEGWHDRKKSCLRYLPLAGQDITTQMMRMLDQEQQQDSSSSSSTTTASLQQFCRFEKTDFIKCKLAVISLTSDSLTISDNNKDRPHFAHCADPNPGATLPDGGVVTVPRDSLWMPAEESKVLQSAARLVYDCVGGWEDRDAVRDLQRNVILAGGATKMPGFEERFKEELQSLWGCVPPAAAGAAGSGGGLSSSSLPPPPVPSSGMLQSRLPSPTKGPHPQQSRFVRGGYEGVKVVASEERDRSAWIGGSIIGSLSTTRDLWVDRAEFFENF